MHPGFGLNQNCDFVVIRQLLNHGPVTSANRSKPTLRWDDKRHPG